MKIVVFIPCYNESKTITKVIEDFKKELPQAETIVFDNDSIDGSYALAKKAGARVASVKRTGKGYLIQKMLQDIVADIYVIVDGDDTYFAKDVHKLISSLKDNEVDMVVGRRVAVSKKPIAYFSMKSKIVLRALFASSGETW
jgi:glycosyltransferase involved in cell wall biosynthesis